MLALFSFFTTGPLGLILSTVFSPIASLLKWLAGSPYFWFILLIVAALFGGMAYQKHIDVANDKTMQLQAQLAEANRELTVSKQLAVQVQKDNADLTAVNKDNADQIEDYQKQLDAAQDEASDTGDELAVANKKLATPLSKVKSSVCTRSNPEKAPVSKTLEGVLDKLQ